jgi:phosphatidylserine/phosphatidylglycerophosphate/cardiolipin synthase-like enzyme
MDRLSEAVLDLVANTTPDRIERLAERICTATQASVGGLADWARTPAGEARFRTVVDCWAASTVSAAELGGMLRGASCAYERLRSLQEIDIVWTGPATILVPTRKTEQALLQVIRSAESRLFITSFVAYDTATVVSALNDATARGVSVAMLLESSTAHGGGVSFDVIARMRAALPKASVFYWGNKAEPFMGGKVHAKVAVADERICFVSSANLTGHAMERNMEAGLLVRGGEAPRTLHRHLEALVSTNVLTVI